ncbi:MAG: hypothetical protein KIT72_08080 [Polyangiaceae bacterium]|nr:hypothetical protein [Polyangiaceae bacterium]
MKDFDHSPTSGLPKTGRLTSRLRSDRSASLSGQASGTSHLGVDVDPSDLEMLAKRLREIAEDRASASLVLERLAHALEVAGLEVDDERLHLNYSRQGSVSVTVGQRHVAWCQIGPREFGMILQSADVVRRATEAIPGALPGAFTKPDTPTLHVPVSELGRIPAFVMDDWDAAVRVEVERAGKSSYLKKKTGSLYHILMSPRLREEAALLAYPGTADASAPQPAAGSTAWWFGVNNNNNKGAHVKLAEISELLKGGSFRWQVGNSKRMPWTAYQEMLPNDPVLIWTEHGDEEKWGVLGTAMIEGKGDGYVVLGGGRRFDQPLTPYPKRSGRKRKEQVPETEEVRFLSEALGRTFQPLGDVYAAVYGERRKSPITVTSVSIEQFQRIVAFVAERGAK